MPTKIKKIIGLFIVVLTILTSNLVAFADEPYTFDENKKPINSVLGYEPTKIIFGTDLGVNDLSEPSDIFVDENENIFILDSGNKRLLISDRNFKNTKVIDNFTKDGVPSPLNNPKGIYVAKDGTIYIADTGNKRVIKTDITGVITLELLRPKTELFPDNQEFIPKRVISDEKQTVFVLCDNVQRGAVLYDLKGNFIGFYGSNKVEVNISILVDRFWRSLFSRENSDKFVQNVAESFTSFCSDKDGFIYTCTSNSTSSLNMIRKLNPLGKNIFEKSVDNSYQGGFGDLNPVVTRDKLDITQFIDINVNKNGMVFALDNTKGRVFQYDKDSNLVFIFGGLGSQVGTFSLPVAIETIDNKVYVLDSRLGSITEFTSTEFGNYVTLASNLYNDGKYINSVKPWQQVLKMDSNYNLAYIGIGKANLELKQYEKAMSNFKQAGYIKGYDTAFNSLRTKNMRSSFGWYFAIILFLILMMYLPKIKFVKRSIVEISSYINNTKTIKFINVKRRGITDAMAINIHPIDGFMDLFDAKRQRLYVSFIMIILYFFSVLFVDRYYGFIFVGNKDPKSIMFILAQSVGILFLFTVVNWSICTLFTGKGRLKDIWIATTYALQPLILVNFISLILSNNLKLDEGQFINYIVILGQIYFVFMLVKGLEAIHEYSFKKSLLTIASTVVGMILVAILAILIISLVQQIFSFVITVYKEAGIRFR